jgi:Exonuclease
MKFRLPNSLNANAITPSFRWRSQSVLASLQKLTRPLFNGTGLQMSQPTGPDTRFIWIDCEVIEQRFTFLQKMTGLDLGKDKIIEISALITDEKLEILEPQGFERVIHCDENVMNNMDQWCTEQHRKVIKFNRQSIYSSLD